MIFSHSRPDYERFGSLFLAMKPYPDKSSLVYLTQEWSWKCLHVLLCSRTECKARELQISALQVAFWWLGQFLCPVSCIMLSLSRFILIKRLFCICQSLKHSLPVRWSIPVSWSPASAFPCPFCCLMSDAQNADMTHCLYGVKRYFQGLNLQRHPKLIVNLLACQLYLPGEECWMGRKIRT